MVDIPNQIQKLPLPVITRMRIERFYIRSAKSIRRKLNQKIENDSMFYPLVRNNRLYGNEALLHEYSQNSADLYAIIEHGLYFGNNQQKVGLKHEWELGCILTGGVYRKEIISRCFPDYYCEMIGPMIHYAKIDESYRETIKNFFHGTGKTLLFFPIHGNSFFSPEYDTELTVQKIIEVANSMDCKNIIICAYHRQQDLFNKIVYQTGLTKRIFVTTNGDRYDQNFMRRQKTLIDFSDYTISNSLGTHLGYCIFMGKPHILLPQDFSYVGDKKAIDLDFGTSNRSENYRQDFETETKRFQELFHAGQAEITKEQYQVCDFYWGFSQIKTPEQISSIIDNSREYARAFLKEVN